MPCYLDSHDKGVPKNFKRSLYANYRFIFDKTSGPKFGVNFDGMKNSRFSSDLKYSETSRLKMQVSFAIENRKRGGASAGVTFELNIKPAATKRKLYTLRWLKQPSIHRRERDKNAHQVFSGRLVSEL